MVSGVYVKTFSQASHVLFEGHLDNPFFRDIAIQEIKEIRGREIITSRSGALEIHKVGGNFRIKEMVILVYDNGPFGKGKTVGYPFKDKNTPLPDNRTEQGELF